MANTPDFLKYPMSTRDLAFCKVAELMHADVHKDPVSEVLKVNKDYEDGTAIFIQGQPNGTEEIVEAKITASATEKDEILLEGARFRRFGIGGLEIYTKTPTGEKGVRIPPYEKPEIFRSESNPIQS